MNKNRSIHECITSLKQCLNEIIDYNYNFPSYLIDTTQIENRLRELIKIEKSTIQE